MHLPLLCLLSLVVPQDQPHHSKAVEAALTRAGASRSSWESSLTTVPADQRPGLEFLLEHMPTRDLTSLDPQALLEDIRLAYEVRAQVPWGADMPEHVFLNDVLPYAHVTETRDPWRQSFVERFLPLVADCKTPAEAAQVLNRQVFPAVGLAYSTKRRAPDQGPFESIERGVASCTGLSIVLADACRSVGVPARLAGIASWPNKRGNHTWVEVWNDGAWHFVGAAEPDARGLDHGWFSADAAQAQAGSREHGIWAVSYARTESTFPMVWAPDHKDVFAVEVTRRYTNTLAAPAKEYCRLLVRVVDRHGDRVLRRVRCIALDDEALSFTGKSRREDADLNDVLDFMVPPAHTYQLQFAVGLGWRTAREVDVVAGQQQLEVTLVVDSPDDVALRAAFEAWFAAPPDGRAQLDFTPEQRLRLIQDEAGVRRLAFESWRVAGQHGDSAKDVAADRVRWRGHESPYTLKQVGARPEGGWPLVIAMHGGGGVPKEVNDSQWRHMQIYYHEHPEAGGHLYLALRAPNDTWNGFYDDTICGLVEQLIRNLVVHRSVDPDRVSLVGYSHGGYGAFVIGTKIPHRFAAVHASASAPTSGETAGENLGNLRFTYMCGEKDTAFGRIERCRQFATEQATRKGGREDLFPGGFTEVAGKGHGGLPDRDMTLKLVPAVRNAAPKELTWRQTDGLVEDYYWLRVHAPGDGRVAARIEGNRVTLDPEGPERVSVYLDARLVDVHKEVTVTRGEVSKGGLVSPSLEVLCETLERRGDPALAHTLRFDF